MDSPRYILRNFVGFVCIVLLIWNNSLFLGITFAAIAFSEFFCACTHSQFGDCILHNCAVCAWCVVASYNFKCLGSAWSSFILSHSGLIAPSPSHSPHRTHLISPRPSHSPHLTHLISPRPSHSPHHTHLISPRTSHSPHLAQAITLISLHPDHPIHTSSSMLVSWMYG